MTSYESSVCFVTLDLLLLELLPFAKIKFLTFSIVFSDMEVKFGI